MRGQLVAQRSFRAARATRPSSHYHATRGKLAEAEGADFSVAVAHCNPHRVDAEFLRGSCYLSSPGPVRGTGCRPSTAWPSVRTSAAVHELSCPDYGDFAGTHTPPRRPRLLVTRPNPMPISRPSDSPCLWRARTGGHIEQPGAQTEDGGISPPSRTASGRRAVRHLFGTDHVFATCSKGSRDPRATRRWYRSIQTRTRADHPAIGPNGFLWSYLHPRARIIWQSCRARQASRRHFVSEVVLAANMP